MYISGKWYVAILSALCYSDVLLLIGVVLAVGDVRGTFVKHLTLPVLLISKSRALFMVV